MSLPKLKELTKAERLYLLLGLFGDGKITREQFDAQMKEHNLTQDDIDRFCRGEFE